jgi:FkbM family methyltransferase
MLKFFFDRLSSYKSKSKKPLNVGSYKFTVPQDVAWSFVNGQYYETNVIHWFDKVISLCSNRPVIYDVGANCGYYVLRYANLADSIYAFEPVTDTYDSLIFNIKSNKIPNAFAFQVGLSEKDESVTINLYNTSACNSLFNRDVPAEHSLKKIGQENVLLVNLDGFIDTKSLLPPDIIKIDVEGSELKVIQGAKNTINNFCPVLIIEYSVNTAKDAGYKPQDILSNINMKDYTIYGIPTNETDFNLVNFDNLHNIDISNIVAIPKKLKSFF